MNRITGTVTAIVITLLQLVLNSLSFNLSLTFMRYKGSYQPLTTAHFSAVAAAATDQCQNPGIAIHIGCNRR